MSTAYYIYMIPDRSYINSNRWYYAATLQGSLEHKELIGVLTCEKINGKMKQVFTFAMHPAVLLYMYTDHSGVYEEGGNMMLFNAFLVNILQPCSIVKYNSENIPA